MPTHHILNAMVMFYTVSLLSVLEVTDLTVPKITWDNNYPKGDHFTRTFVACFSSESTWNPSGVNSNQGRLKRHSQDAETGQVITRK